MPNKKDEKQVFIRMDLERTSGGVAYYRLPKDLRDFLNLCVKKHGDIEAIALDRTDDGYGWNIGFAIPDVKQETKGENQNEKR